MLAWVADLPGRAGTSTVQANLEEAMVRLAGLERRVLPLELAIQADPDLARQRRAALGLAGELPGGPPQAIAAYLTVEQELGRVARDVDPSDAAVILLATLFGLAMTSDPDEAAVAPDRIRAAVRVLVGGIGLPAASTSANTSS